MVESTLMQLSSGMWDRPAIQQTVGEGDSFLYLAPYGKDQKSGVLWQLDVEFNESKHCLFQSIKGMSSSGSLAILGFLTVLFQSLEDRRNRSGQHTPVTLIGA